VNILSRLRSAFLKTWLKDAAPASRLPGVKRSSKLLAVFILLFVALVIERCLALRRKLRSPFRAAALQYETAGFCCHPGSESVGAGPLNSAGLKCAFHCDSTWLLFAQLSLRR